MRRSATIRYLVGAWLAVLAVLALAYVLKPDDGPLLSQVDAAYEVMPEAPYVTFDEGSPARVPKDVAAVDSAEVETPLASPEAPKGSGRIHGTVRAEGSRAPLANVRVHLRGDAWWPNWTTETDAEGAYSLEDLPPGVYTLSAGGGRADGLERTIRHSLPVGDGQAQRVDFTLERGGRVWGQVTNLAGEPLKNARVLLGTSDSIVSQVAQAAKQRRMLGASTNEHGNYVIRGVPFEREWRVWVDEDALAPVLTPAFVLHPTRPHVRMDVTLLPGTTIRGRVETTAGRPVEQAEVTCIPRYGALLAPMHRARTARNTRSEADGSFELTGLPAGDYQIMSFKEGYRIAFKGKPVYPDGRTDLVGVRLVLEPAMGEGTHAVYGRVVDEGGEPVEGAEVGLAAVGMDTLSFGGTNTQTAADGAFRFEGLGAGAFLLAVGKDGYQDHVAEKVRVDTETVVTLRPEASIRGVVKFPGGKRPEGGYAVRVVRRVDDDGNAASFLQAMEAARSAQGFDDPSGAFELKGVPPGTLILEATAAGFAPGRVEVMVADGESVDGVRIRLPREAAQIAGQVIEFGGAPVAGAAVRAIELGTGAPGLLGLFDRRRGQPEARTDEDGRYVLGGLASATYRVSIEHEDFAPVTLTVQAQAGQPPAQANAVLRGGGIIEGTAQPGSMITVAGDGFSSMVATNDQGTFRMLRVPAGEYLARAVISSANDFDLAPEIRRRRVAVREGQTLRVAFTDEPEGRTVSGRLQPAPGQDSVGMVLLRMPGSPAPNPSDLIWQGELGVSDPETSRYVVAEALLEPDGSYRLTDIPPGRYVLEVYVNSLLSTLTGNQARLEKREEIRVD